MRMELDVRSVPAAQRDVLIFDTFAALHSGEAFELVTDGDPAAVRDRFEREHRDRYEWWPLERGPERWRVQVGRRAVEGPWTITTYLQRDHERLDALFRLALETPGAAGLQLFRRFRLGLERHIVIEESMLFPAFERGAGIPSGGPTEVMRREHVVIKEVLQKLDGHFASGKSTTELASQFFEVIGAHNMKEEQILYPSCDHVVGGDGKGRFIDEMRAR